MEIMETLEIYKVVSDKDEEYGSFNKLSGAVALAVSMIMRNPKLISKLSLRKFTYTLSKTLDLGSEDIAKQIPASFYAKLNPEELMSNGD